ncbi:MAG: hypothetical protein HYZ27_08315 [Deltaproteobacteria bacterium]|nr:hypothetical protein [Deltaproteobacteria bacterium]
MRAFCLVLLGALPALGQEPPAKSAGELSDAQEEAIEAEIRKELTLAPIGDPRYLDQLWELARQLTMRRAYCRAAKHLEAVEATAGNIADNRAFAAQAFFQCARTRLGQGFVAEADDALQRSMNIAGARPEHRDLLFKLAVVRAKEAVDKGDLDGAESNLEEARRLGVDEGPGAGGRMADWAIPLINEAANKLAGWSHDLLEADNRELAARAAAVTLRFDPNNRTALAVQRDILFRAKLLPLAGSVLAAVVVAAVIFRLVRRRQLGHADDLEDEPDKTNVERDADAPEDL